MSVKSSVRIIPGRYALSVGRAEMRSPPGWIWMKLTDVARLESGHTPSRAHEEYWNGSIPWVGIVDARDNHGKVIKETAQTITEAGLANSAARLLPPQTVCLVRTAASIGYVTILGGTMVTSQDLVDWVCGQHLDPHFLMHLFIAEKESIKSFGKGSAHKTVYFPEVQAFHVCVPPVSEQRRVVTKLEALQFRSRRVRKALDEVPALLDELRQSILAAAFRGDLTKDWREKNPDVEPAERLLQRIRAERRKKWEMATLAKMTSKGKTPSDQNWKTRYEEPVPPEASALPTLPEGWCWTNVGELAEVATGGTPRRSVPENYANGTIPWVTSGALSDEYVSRPTEMVAEAALAESNLTVFEPGTLLLAMYGEGRTRGTVAELTISAATNQAIAAICLSGVASHLRTFLRFALVAAYMQIRETSSGGVQPNLNLEKVRRIPVPLCPLSEADIVIATLLNLMNSIGRTRQTVELLEINVGDCERAILSKAFRGELVPQDPNDEPAAAMLARLKAAPDHPGTPDTPSVSPAKKRGRPPRA